MVVVCGLCYVFAFYWATFGVHKCIICSFMSTPSLKDDLSLACSRNGSDGCVWSGASQSRLASSPLAHFDPEPMGRARCF